MAAAIKIRTKSSGSTKKRGRPTGSTKSNARRGKTTKRGPGRPKGSAKKSTNKKRGNVGAPRGPRIYCDDKTLKRHQKILAGLASDKEALDAEHAELVQNTYKAMKAAKKDGVPVALIAEPFDYTDTYVHVMLSNGKPSGRRPGRPKNS